MKSKYVVMALIVIILLVVSFFVFNQDSDAVFLEAKKLYEQKKQEGINFSSQCLGVISVNGIGYAVDIVHVPRIEEDNLAENQCGAYSSGNVSHFIELDKHGEFVRVS